MEEIREKVLQSLATIRPYLVADGGDIELVDVDESTGVVKVKLTGACAGCPMSQLTLQMFVEKKLKDTVPGVSRVMNIGFAGFEDE